jgi:hypothetical protein
MTKAALLMAVSVLAIPMWSLCAQVEGPFELPERFRKHRFPQVHVADCSLPLGIEKQAPRAVKTYRIGGVTAQMSKQLRVEGKDTGGAPWALDVEIKSGGCWLWRADLDRNGKEDLIMVTSDATSAGDSIATLIMIDDRGRPVPWQALGHYDGEESGLSNLVDLDGDGRAELLFLYVEGIDRGQARATSITCYEIRDAHLKRVDGPFAGEMFPVVQPKNAKLREEPDLTNSVDTNGPGATIASLIRGRKENCGMQVPLTRGEEGALKVDRDAAEVLGQGCYDKLALSDGRKLSLPGVVVLDRANGREVAILDTARLLIEAKMRRLAIRFAGRLCDDGCHPFFLWAAEQPGPVGNQKRH